MNLSSVIFQNCYLIKKIYTCVFNMSMCLGNNIATNPILSEN